MLQWLPQCQFAGILMAYDNGFYRDENLEVIIEHSYESYSSTEALKNGDVDIITSMLVDALIAQDIGTPLVNVLQTSATSSIMIISRTPLNSIRDLNGKRISRWTNGFFDTAVCFATSNALDIDWIPILSNIYPFAAGAVDAMVATEYNEYFQVRMAGIDISDDNIIYMRDEGYNVPEDGVYTTIGYYNDHPDVVRRFVKATEKGWEWVRDPKNFDTTVDRIVSLMRNLKISSSRVNQEFMLRTILRLQENGEGRIGYVLDKSSFDFTVRMLLDNNLILSPVEYGEFTRP